MSGLIVGARRSAALQTAEHWAVPRSGWGYTDWRAVLVGALLVAWALGVICGWVACWLRTAQPAPQPAPPRPENRGPTATPVKRRRTTVLASGATVRVPAE